MSLHKLLIVYARSDLRDTRRKLELGARSWGVSAMGVGNGKRLVRIGNDKELARPIRQARQAQCAALMPRAVVSPCRGIEGGAWGIGICALLGLHTWQLFVQS